VKKNAGLIICHKGNGLATLVGMPKHGLELFDFSNPFPSPGGYPPKNDTSQRVPDGGWYCLPTGDDVVRLVIFRTKGIGGVR
jgi:hypothetical protein